MITLTQEQFDKTILAVAKRDAMLAIRIVADMVGWLFLLIGVGFLCNDARQQSYEKGLVDGADYVKGQIKNYLTGKEDTK